MTITDVTRLPGTASCEYLKGNKYTIPFEVHFTDGYDEAALVLNADDRLPKIGWTLGEEDGAIGSDTSVVCTSIVPSLKAGSLYTPTGPGSDPVNGIAVYVAAFVQLTPQFAINPLDRIDIQWGGSDITQVPTKDQSGAAIVNSAGQPYTGVPAYPIRAGSVTITIRQAENPSDIVIEYSNTTNSSSIWGVDAGNGLIGKIGARKAQEGATPFWELSIPINFRRDGWQLKLFDNGYLFLNDDGKPQASTDDLGNAKPTAVLLDGAGHELTPPTAAPVPFPADGYKIYEETDWSGLGLPNPFGY